MNAYPEAGEAVIVFMPHRMGDRFGPAEPIVPEEATGDEPAIDAGSGSEAHDRRRRRSGVLDQAGGDADSVGPNKRRAEARARTTVRRYCTSNGIDRLLTLTFAPPFCTDARELIEHRKRFIRRLRCDLGRRFPYVWVPELHKDGVKLHAHLGVAQYIAKDRLREVWGHGHVDARLIRARGAASPLEHRRKAARYLAKYVGKAFAAQDIFGCHRYEVGQGFQPKKEAKTFDNISEARRWASLVMGGDTPVHVWSSSESEDWQGPSTEVAFWTGAS